MAFDPDAQEMAAAARAAALGNPATRQSYLSHIRAAAARSRSSSMATVVYADSAASATLEKWPDLTAWAGANQQVNGGALFNSGGTAANAGLNRAWALGTSGKGRAVAVVDLVAGAGRILIGVSSDVAGAAPAANNANVKGLSIAVGATASSNLNVDTATTGSNQVAPTAGRYIVTITVDELDISVVAVRAGAPALNSTGFAMEEFRAQFARGAFSITSLFIQNTSAANLAGSSVNLVGWRNAIATLPAAFGIEGLGRSVHWTRQSVRHVRSNTTSLAGIKVSTPVGYDSRIQYPAIIMAHGNGSSEHQFSDNIAAIQVELLASGFVVITAAFTNNLFSWGVQPSLDIYAAAAKLARDNYNIGLVGLFGNSMGGIESLNLLADDRIPGVMAWGSTSTTYSLAENYANALFTGVINTVYDIGAGGNKLPYASATFGYDPAVRSADYLHGLPMLILTTEDDVAVTPAANGFALAAAAQAVSAEVIAPRGLTGGHSFNSGGGQTPLSGVLGLQGTSVTPAAVIGAFFRKYLQP